MITCWLFPWSRILNILLRKKEQIKEKFSQIAPHLTFLDFSTLEKQGADIQSKIQHLEQENQGTNEGA